MGTQEWELLNPGPQKGLCMEHESDRKSSSVPGTVPDTVRRPCYLIDNAQSLANTLVCPMFSWLHIQFFDKTQ